MNLAKSLTLCGYLLQAELHLRNGLISTDALFIKSLILATLITKTKEDQEGRKKSLMVFLEATLSRQSCAKLRFNFLGSSSIFGNFSPFHRFHYLSFLWTPSKWEILSGRQGLGAQHRRRLVFAAERVQSNETTPHARVGQWKWEESPFGLMYTEARALEAKESADPKWLPLWTINRSLNRILLLSKWVACSNAMVSGGGARVADQGMEGFFWHKTRSMNWVTCHRRVAWNLGCTRHDFQHH